MRNDSDAPGATGVAGLWGPDNRGVEGWIEALESWRRAWARSMLPLWPWADATAAPADGSRVQEPPAAALSEEALPPFRAHGPGKTIEQLSVGDSASVTRRISQADIDAFARISGDDNPAHVDAEWAATSRLGRRVAHGMLTAGLISAALGTELPGPGSVYMSQTLRWVAPVCPDDLLTATVTVKEIVAEKGRVILETVVARDGEPVLTGEALVMPPPAAAATSAAAETTAPPTPAKRPPARRTAKTTAAKPTRRRPPKGKA